MTARTRRAGGFQLDEPTAAVAPTQPAPVTPAPAGTGQSFPPAAARPEPAAPPEPTPAPVATDRNSVSVVSGSSSRLESLLEGSDTPDTEPAAENVVDEPVIPLSAIAGGRRVDPDLDLVPLGTQVPRYMLQAIRAVMFFDNVKQQDVIREGLRRVLPPKLLDECRRAAANGGGR